MKQANELGGSVRKGEHSQIVVFWKVDQIPNAHSESDSDEHEADDKTRRRFVLRYYRLFNLEQCELPQAVLDKLLKIETHQNDPSKRPSRSSPACPIRPRFSGLARRPFTAASPTRITLPPRELFTSAEEEVATRFHDLHATGHRSRLNRESITDAVPFGSPMYSSEKLSAEMGAAFLCADAGISPAIENQAAYIQGWLKKWRARHFASNQQESIMRRRATFAAVFRR